MGTCLFGGGSIHQGPLYGARPGCIIMPVGTGLGLCPGHLLFHIYRVPFGAGTPPFAHGGTAPTRCATEPSLPRRAAVGSSPGAVATCCLVLGLSQKAAPRMKEDSQLPTP